jgi:hypothetical protein
MMPQPGKTLPEVNIALAQVEAQEAELGRQQRLVQKELQRLETQQQILDQKMEQNEAAEAQLEGQQMQLTGQQAVQAVQQGNPWQAQAMMQGVMPQPGMGWHRPFPAQAMQPGMEWPGTGIWGQRRSRGSYFIAGAVVVAGLYILGRNSDTLRPVTVGVTKEGLAFKDWLTGSMVSARKRLRGIAGEARQANRKEEKGKTDFSAKEENVLKELDKHLEKLEKELEEKGGR